MFNPYIWLYNHENGEFLFIPESNFLIYLTVIYHYFLEISRVLF